MHSRIETAIGKRSERLVVVGESEQKHRYLMVQCKCDCGSDYSCRLSKILSGEAKSCGCIGAEILAKQKAKWPKEGDVIARWTVLGDTIRNKYKHVFVLCRCQCGTVQAVRVQSLLSGECKSCGCWNDEVRRRLKKPPESQTKTCKICGKEKPVAEFYRSWRSRTRYQSVCKTCKNTTVHRIGGNPGVYDDLLEKQKHVCAICGKPQEKGRTQRLHIDHCHETHDIRGLLCTRCNVGLGCFKDNIELLENAKRYLRMKTKIEFSAPPGTIPEGTAAGEEFDLVCTFRVKSNADICLVVLGDVHMPGYSEKGRDKGKPSYADEHKAMMGDGGAPTQTGYA